jgi:hypothetical protein
VSLACASCGGALQGGLPNVQALGGSSTVDVRPQASLSSGDEACGNEGTVLRGKYPPCPKLEKTRAELGFANRPPPPVVTPLVVPWSTSRARAWPCLENAEPALAVASQPIEVLPASCAFER